MASSKNRGFLPQTDAALLAWSVNFKTLITATPAAFGLTAAMATAYSTLHDAFATAYQVAKDPNTRTKPNVNAKDAAREALKNDVRLLAQLVSGTASVTDTQKLSLGLTVRKTPSPIPAPTARPAVDLVSAIGYTVSIDIHDSSTSNKRGKPSGAVAAWVYTYVGDTYPSDPTLWDFQGATTKAKYDIAFDNFLAGGTQVWVCAAWINGKQVAGPVSVPITTNLQGGGASQQQSKMKVAA